MASQSTPDKIRRIEKKLSNDVKTVHGALGDEAHQQATLETRIVEENDGYPALMQRRLDYLRWKIDCVAKGRALGTICIGSLAFMGLIAAVVSIGSGVPLPAGMGLAFLDIATGGALMGIVHLAFKPAMNRADKEEREMFDGLAGYHREKSLAMAAHANQDDPAGKALPATSLQSDFAARADAAPLAVVAPVSASKLSSAPTRGGHADV